MLALFLDLREPTTKCRLRRQTFDSGWWCRYLIETAFDATFQSATFSIIEDSVYRLVRCCDVGHKKLRRNHRGVGAVSALAAEQPAADHQHIMVILSLSTRVLLDP